MRQWVIVILIINLSACAPLVRPTAPPADVPNCAIKGIAAQGRAYYVPGAAGYAVATVQPERGDHWFCTEPDARSAGFHRAGH